MRRTIRALIVDQQALFRQGLAGLLSAQPDFSVVGEMASACDALLAARDLRPDQILTGMRLADGTGLDLAQALRANGIQTDVIFLTTDEDEDLVFEAIRLGARGYLPKDITLDDLLSHLRAVSLGGAAITPAMASRVFAELAGRATLCAPERLRLGLTHREMDVFYELENGASNREIADKLIISENTVKHHVHEILAKLELHNRREVSRLAHQ
jgi:DNA-binding NarL/FixJ family response regulator